MAIWNWNTFTGISDDSFLGRNGEFLDCNNIDILDNARYVDGSKHPDISEIGTNLGNDFTVCKDGIYPSFASDTKTFIGFSYDSSVSDGGQLGAYQIEQIGTSTLPVTYFFKNGYIRQQVYNGSSLTFDSPIVTNVPTGVPTASCIGAGRMYFAVLNKIYVLDTVVTDPTTTLSQVKATAANSNIPFGYTIKYLYIYMDVMNVVATNGRDTTIYQLIETSTDVWTIRYYHTKQGVVCIGAAGEGNNIFWHSKDSIYQSNGTQSEKVKVYGKYEMSETFSVNSISTISDGIYKIADGTQLYEYGHKKPGYGAAFIRKTRCRQLTAMSGRLEVSYNGTSCYGGRDNVYVSAPYQDFTINSLPYEAGNFNQKKEGTAIRIGHMLPAYSTYTSTSTLASITVQVITDEMDQKGITTPVTIATIETSATDVTPLFTNIDMKSISDAIATAGYNPDFSYIKLIVNGLRGDLSSTSSIYGINLGRKTPKIFGLELVHNEILKGIPN